VTPAPAGPLTYALLQISVVLDELVFTEDHLDLVYRADTIDALIGEQDAVGDRCCLIFRPRTDEKDLLRRGIGRFCEEQRSPVMGWMLHFSHVLSLHVDGCTHGYDLLAFAARRRARAFAREFSGSAQYRTRACSRSFS
jgi:hypothetical protein